MSAAMFMTPEILHREFYEVETTTGESFLINADLVPHPLPLGLWHDVPQIEALQSEDNEAFDLVHDALSDFLLCDSDKVLRIRKIETWAARLSASGYLDCTDWLLAADRQDAARALLELYFDGPDPDWDETISLLPASEQENYRGPF